MLPTARSGLATAVVLAMARGIGETAPVLLVAGYTKELNANPFSGPQTSLPLFIYNAVHIFGTPRLRRARLRSWLRPRRRRARAVHDRQADRRRGPGELTKRQRRKLAGEAAAHMIRWPADRGLLTAMLGRQPRWWSASCCCQRKARWRRAARRSPPSQSPSASPSQSPSSRSPQVPSPSPSSSRTKSHTPKPSPSPSKSPPQAAQEAARHDRHGPADVQPAQAPQVRREKHGDGQPDHEPGQRDGARLVDRIHPEQQRALRPDHHRLPGHGRRVQLRSPAPPGSSATARQRGRPGRVRAVRPDEHGLRDNGPERHRASSTSRF